MKAMLPTGDISRAVEFGEAEEPEPREDEAVITVEAYSVNRGETFRLEDPLRRWLPGKDVAGTVLRPAADGSGPARGTRVVGHPPARGWAQRAAVPTRDLAVLPDRVDTTTAAALPLAGLTALRLLRAAGPIAGRRILLTGASGGVGHYFTELASGIGARITAVSAGEERGRRLLDLGATEVVPDVEKAEGPFDLVLESVGGTSLPAALARLAPEGLLIWFGQASRAPVTLNFFDFFKAGVGGSIRHFDYTRSAPSHGSDRGSSADFGNRGNRIDYGYGDDLAVLVRLVATGRLHPEIGIRHDWSRTAEAITDLRARRIRGNAVLITS
ncbi:zinc-binding dehydrogenase [Streptacidiphilus sp. N1-3]|uniref:Zinc-binding dehydrogenase n=1 Tax=Streptacidiphilus alkalitolerans TaxID=3342712 RepID=A0ABV6WYI0_9ACTN